MKQQLQKLGITSAHLNSLVETAGSRLASRANNEGMADQLTLLDQAGYNDEEIWAELLQEILKPGMEVDVTDPKHDSSPHSFGFRGTVHSIGDEYITVRDMEDDHFDIEFDEIESFELGEE